MNSPILGAFITGIIVPREGGLTIALTEKLEDMVAIIFLPLVSPAHDTPTLRPTYYFVIVLHVVRSLNKSRTAE